MGTSVGFVKQGKRIGSGGRPAAHTPHDTKRGNGMPRATNNPRVTSHPHQKGTR